MGGPRQQHLTLIIARELASQLATATFISDAQGELVFYNEAAEEILGRRFAEAGSMRADGWSDQFKVERVDGGPMSLEEMPMGIAMTKRQPAHGSLRMTGLDGVGRVVSITAVPLFSSPSDLVGMIALFWEEPAAGRPGPT